MQTERIIRIVARRIRIESSIAMQGRGGRDAGRRRSGESTSRGGRYISSSSPINNNSTKSEIKDTERVAGGGGMNNRRRRSSNRNNAGRGRSHGNNRNNNAKNQASSAYNNERTTVQIIESSFQSIYHNKLCRAAKYKVHAPLCRCPKVVKLRQRYDEEENNGNNHPKNNNNNISTVAPSSGGYSENIQFDIDGNISHQLSQLKLDGASSSGSSNPFDNLIVLPDTKGSNPPIYICNNTNLETFQRNPPSCELKLAGEIFSNNNGKVEDTTSLDNNIPSFKVSCAICLLTSHQRNGFVAIISSSLQDVQSTIQSARDATLRKTEQRHADHAHFVCAIKLSSLDSLLLAGKTRRSKNEEITKDILSQIRNDDGVTSTLPTTDMKIPSEETALVEIKMGHHLTSLLWLLQTQKSNTKQQYIMVLGYIDSNQSITLDLPGGKRHLGESTIQGFVREVEEECSLCIDYDWAFSFVSKRYGGNLDDDMNDNKARGREEGDNTVIQALEPRKVKGVVSGDAFFMMPPP